VADHYDISDDPGTILDSYQNVPRPLPPSPAPGPRPPGVQPGLQPAPPPVEEVLYRSPYRWTAPRIVICDDGSLEDGEMVHVRTERICIGRTKGDIVVGHDVAMSSLHAEIVRADCGGKPGWVLRDLGSSNGTLARVRAVALRPGLTVLIGSKRFRFDPPTGKSATSRLDEPATAMIADFGGPASEAHPALLEIPGPNAPAGRRFPLARPRLTIGRPGRGHDIELDDPCVAALHAILTRDYSGAWQMEAQPSLNGLWVRIEAVKLIDNSLFQCGEQRFRFRM